MKNWKLFIIIGFVLMILATIAGLYSIRTQTEQPTLYVGSLVSMIGLGFIFWGIFLKNKK